MKTDDKYLNFPIPMLRGLYVDRVKFCDDVFDVGIFRYSQTLSGTESDCYRDACEYLGITQKHQSACMRNAKQILSTIPAGSPNVGINKDMLFDFYKNDKSEFDCVCLGGFLANRSIIGAKTHSKTNKLMIHARMFGYVSPKVVPVEMSAIEAKYRTRWYMDRILLELQMGWKMKMYSNNTRGVYISFALELPELKRIADNSTQKNRIAEFKQQHRNDIETTSKQHRNSSLNKKT